MAEFGTFNLGEILGQAEAIKGARNRNALAALEQDWLRRQQGVMDDPNATPEQFARVGRSDVANALVNSQRAGLEQQQSEREQRVEQIKLAYAGLSAVAQNPAQAEFWEQDFKAAGLLSPQFDWRAVPPQDLQAYAQRELQGVQAALRALNSSRYKTQLAPSAVQTYEYYKGLPPEEQQRMLETMRAPVVREVGGVQTIVRPGGGTQPLSTVEQEAAARAQIAGAEAGAKTTATAGAEARADLPRIEGNAEDTLRLLGQLKRAPLQYIFGAASMAPIVPGTAQADVFALWEQAQGQAFLKAFETLKGGGQITEVEGQKATAAITRLAQRKMSPKAAQEAISELEGIVRAGLARARKKAGSAPATGAPRESGNRSLDDLLNQYGN